MLSRALSLATVTLLIGCLTAGVARAGENLDAGKSPSQIFSNTCSACHKSPRGLLKNMSASSLPGFLRQHYTTGTDMASVLSSYLISNGAADPRYQSKDQPKQKDAKQDGRPDQPDRLGRRQPAGRTCAGGFPAGCRREHGRKARARAQAATRSGSDVRARRLTPPSLQMGRPRCRPRPTANRASGRSRADVASPPPKNRRRPSRSAPGDAAKEDASRDAAKAETAATDPVKTDPAKTDASRPTRSRARATSRPARQRSPQASGQIRDRQGRCSQGERRQRADVRSGPIRCRRSPRRRQLPQRPRLSRPRQRHQRRLHR